MMVANGARVWGLTRYVDCMKSTWSWAVMLVLGGCHAALAPPLDEDRAATPEPAIDASMAPTDSVVAAPDLRQTDLAAPSEAADLRDIDLATPPDLTVPSLVDLTTLDATATPSFVKNSTLLPEISAIAGAGGTLYVGLYFGVMATTNGGASFTKISDDAVNRAWSHGDAVYVTTDSGLYVAKNGAMWFDRVFDRDAGTFALQGIGGAGTDLVVAGEGGCVVVSSDNGSQWNTLPPVAGAPRLTAVWVDPEVVLMGSFSFPPSLSLRSTNRGAAWEPISSGSIPSRVAAFWGDGQGTIWAVGDDNISLGPDVVPNAKIARSTDRGITWSALDPQRTGGLTAIWGSSANDLWAVGGELVVHSTNGGEAWTDVEAGITGGRAVWGTSSTDVWIGGKEGLWHLE